MAKTKRPVCPSCGALGRHLHDTPRGAVSLCDGCDEFAPYVLAALVDDARAEAVDGPGSHYAITGDDHDTAWTRQAA